LRVITTLTVVLTTIVTIVSTFKKQGLTILACAAKSSQLDCDLPAQQPL